MINWFFPILMFFSVSLRTPSVQPNPYDYELCYRLQKQNIFYLDRQWERENGHKVIDEEYWLKYDQNHIFARSKYRNYTNQVNYFQNDLRYSTNNFSAGYALKHTSDYTHNLVVGYDISHQFNFILTSGKLISRGEILSNFHNLSYALYNEAKFGLTQNLDLSALFKYEYYNRPFYQFKIGLEIEIPQIKINQKGE